MQYNCPVCNKAGLPDYTKIQASCPQCNSDLKPFMLLDSISNRKSNRTKYFTIAGIILLVVAFGTLFYYPLSLKRQFTNNNLKIVQQYQDSIKLLSSTISILKQAQTNLGSEKNEIVIRYKVKYGDYPSKIAKFFYNDWAMYKKIETDNNLQQPYILQVGQVLIIKIIKQ